MKSSKPMASAASACAPYTNLCAKSHSNTASPELDILQNKTITKECHMVLNSGEQRISILAIAQLLYLHFGQVNCAKTHGAGFARCINLAIRKIISFQLLTRLHRKLEKTSCYLVHANRADSFNRMRPLQLGVQMPFDTGEQ